MQQLTLCIFAQLGYTIYKEIIYICNVRISTSYHNKAICRRSKYLCPRFGEGFLFRVRCAPTTHSLEGYYSNQSNQFM